MFEKIFVITLLVWAVNAAFWPQMIFGRVVLWAENRGCPEWLMKVIFICVVCQVIYYGSFAYWLIYGNSVKEWIIVVIASMGLSAVLVSLVPEPIIMEDEDNGNLN